MNPCLDNIIFSLQRAGGISVYWSELWSRLLRDGLSAVAIEAQGAKQNIFRANLDIPSHQTRLDTRPVRMARYLRAPALAGRDELVHSSYYRRPSSGRVPHVQSCYDFTYERFWRGPARWAHSWQKRQAVESANGVICISESTRRDLLYYCPSVREENTCVIHLGFSDSFRRVPEQEAQALVAPHSAPDGPYSVFVGDRSAYKNFPVAVDAVALCPGHRLVVVGGGPLKERDHRRLEHRLLGRWTHIDRAPSALLNALYNRAHALIYPSSYEGFGIPVIEAMAAGCPVIAVNVSSIPEAAGDAGLLLDRPDAEGVAEQLRRLEDAGFCAGVQSRGLHNAQRFSWESCYRDTLSFYARVLGQWSSP
ncbi:glycosyltransferase family 4 protein [Hydrogenophaga sp. R2]|uniref:glycosyltransferase family 4 protein n=1 Tax=Hydrogenophaga sp. R2 TaxID=3132827 RepID=UPI003CEE16D3